PPLTPHTYLGQNYPNPFNPSTEIHFSLAEPGKVIIDIYNQKGELVRNLLNGNFTAGNNKVFWDGLDNQGKIVSSGVYYYRMRNGAYSSTRKMLLLK
ncbi:MAG: T9SS type A sorting domain-containing protein, partial [Candidatus Cloacimonetes bacterium]|nr:T9SS type A sorting domain-containing protein [Candidatus Cloacimonadota bacterium]